MPAKYGDEDGGSASSSNAIGEILTLSISGVSNSETMDNSNLHLEGYAFPEEEEEEEEKKEEGYAFHDLDEKQIKGWFTFQNKEGVSYDDEDDEDDDDKISDDGNDYLYNDENFYVAVQAELDSADLLRGAEASVAQLKDLSPGGNASSATESTSSGPSQGENVMERFTNFKQFDIVDDFPDHAYSQHHHHQVQQIEPPKTWAKTIQEEWKILEHNLPETIFVRVCESRMELMRFVIIGASGTPYHDGLFFFDCLFPPTYPVEPPMILYQSGGLRLNPNLYEDGKVCLSLLGTWHGEGTEMWIPNKSTMLQVLVSIQALILNSEPFYNEPDYDLEFPGTLGEKRSHSYNEKAFLMSLRTIIYTLRRPPKHFEDFIAGYFRERENDILAACKAYMDGAKVGSIVVKDGVADTDNAPMTGSTAFRTEVGKMMNILVRAFGQNLLH